MGPVFLVLAILLAIIHWLARWRGLIRLGAATKPLVMVVLILWSLSSGGWTGSRILVGAGLLFSLAGDVMLLLPHRFFIPGLFAFLVTHICYLVWFTSPVPVFHPILMAVLLILLPGMYFYFHNLFENLKKMAYGKKFMIPVTLYGITLGMMTLAGCQTLLRPDWPQNAAGISALGGILFLISDSLLGYNRFVHPLPGGKTLEMITYHLAQMAIIYGSHLR